MNFKHYTKNLLFLLSIISTNTYTQNYFQQEVDYIIDVSLNDNLHTLKGFIEIDYTNNSPQTLDTLWFHLWPNAYKNNSTRLAQQKIEDGDTKFHYSTEEEKGYIDSLKFRVNGGISYMLAAFPTIKLPDQNNVVKTNNKYARLFLLDT